ncbi:MAG TPA: copper resistance protein CopZ [Ruminococcaceae bacterium]|nr:copper resistance protein CopZ [Oscillospiraceae bacterium]
MLKITMGIDGMMCGMCESHINDAIRREFKVKKVTSSHTKKQTIILTEKPLDEEKLRKVIDNTGYKVMSIETAEEEKKGGLFGLFKK